MLDKILELFFSNKNHAKKAQCLTIVRRTSFFNETKLLNKKTNKIKIEKQADFTCLSKYFINIKGLNLQERQVAKV